MQKSDTLDVFYKWTSFLETEGENRFLFKHRRELLDMLVRMFYENNIPIDEAKLFCPRVIDTMTTQEGRSGKGKYKGWKEAVEKDFRMILSDVYIDYPNTKQSSKSKSEAPKITAKEQDDFSSFPTDRFIIAWAKNKFGKDVSPNILKQAHQVGNGLNLQFMKDLFESDWAKGKGQVPDWYRNA